MPCKYSRRELLKSATLIGGATLIGAPLRRAFGAGTVSPVAVAKCQTYDPKELVPIMNKMFDQIGGLGKLVNGKTVAIKINLTGNPRQRYNTVPVWDTHYTHPAVVAATVAAMGKAGAKRIRILESPENSGAPIEEIFLAAGGEPKDILSAAANVEFENTNFLNKGKKYSRLMLPAGAGYIFPGFDLNHSYEECDVFVSIAKLKEHATAGYTGALKNCFGCTPITIYGQQAGIDEPAIVPRSGRTPLHYGTRAPSKSAPQEKAHNVPKQDTARVPRIVVDICTARPIHLSIIDGIKTFTGGEGPWIAGVAPVAPGILIAGLNPVNTDAVGMATMNFDPMGDRGKPPFENADSTLRLAEDAGLGSRDISKIEVVGASVKSVMFDYAAPRVERMKNPPQRRQPFGGGGRGPDGQQRPPQPPPPAQ
jgi:uncharacterized protein (DUF362 family)